MVNRTARRAASKPPTASTRRVSHGARSRSARPAGRASEPGACADNAARSRVAVDRMIQDIRQTRIALLHSTIALALTMLERAVTSKGPADASRCLRHAQEEYKLASRLLAANTLLAEESASVRSHLAELRCGLEDVEKSMRGGVRE